MERSEDNECSRKKRHLFQKGAPGKVTEKMGKKRVAWKSVKRVGAAQERKEREKREKKEKPEAVKRGFCFCVVFELGCIFTAIQPDRKR